MRLCAVPLAAAVLYSLVWQGQALERKAQEQEARQEATQRAAMWERKAADFASVTQVWDRTVALRILDGDAHGQLADLRARIFWLHQQVGACVGRELESLHGDYLATYRFVCQRGAVVASFHLDEEQKLESMTALVQGQRASTTMQLAQSAVVGWLSWEQATPDFLQPRLASALLEEFETGEHCRMGRDLLVGPGEARSLLICDDQPDRVLSLLLNKKGKIVAGHIDDAGVAG
jgi:hypothetical protein